MNLTQERSSRFKFTKLEERIAPCGCVCVPEKGNNGVGNGLDPQPPGDPPINDGVGTAPGSPGNKGGV